MERSRAVRLRVSRLEPLRPLSPAARRARVPAMTPVRGALKLPPRRHRPPRLLRTPTLPLRHPARMAAIAPVPCGTGFLHRPPRRRTRGAVGEGNCAGHYESGVFAQLCRRAARVRRRPTLPRGPGNRFARRTMTGWVLTVLLSSSAGPSAINFCEVCLEDIGSFSERSAIAACRRSRPASPPTRTLAWKNHRELHLGYISTSDAPPGEAAAHPWSIDFVRPGLMRPSSDRQVGARGTERPCIAVAVHGDDELGRIDAEFPRGRLGIGTLA